MGIGSRGLSAAQYSCFDPTNIDPAPNELGVWLLSLKTWWFFWFLGSVSVAGMVRPLKKCYIPIEFPSHKPSHSSGFPPLDHWIPRIFPSINDQSSVPPRYQQSKFIPVKNHHESALQPHCITTYQGWLASPMAHLCLFNNGKQSILPTMFHSYVRNYTTGM